MQLSELSNTKVGSSARSSFQPIYLLFGLVALAVVYLSMAVGVATSKFSYTLDDPLIHLRLAEQIASGHYGINSSEFSAPSSSILWPFLLVPFAKTSFALYVPLVMNVVFVSVLLGLVFRVFGGNWRTTLFVAILLLITDSVGLIFSGMEHNLQILISIGCAIGAMEVERSGKISRWLLPALVLGPLIRYENFGVTLPIAVFLYVRGFRRECALVLLTVFGLAGIFSLFLHSLGLGFLPNSVVAKSSFSFSLFRIFVRNPYLAISSDVYAFFFEVCLVGLAFLRVGKRKAIGWVALAALWLHATFGWYGQWDRYECYLNGYLFVLAMGPDLSYLNLPELRRRPLPLLVSAGIGLYICFGYFRGAVHVPKGAEAIASQQVQMHRFVDHYWKAPVAVNDLGWVSWNNPNFVLDLWGLGSSDALKFRKTSPNADWMEQLCLKHGVRLVMIYREWFDKGVPHQWTRVATLSRGAGFNRGDVVSFYATDPGAIETIQSELREFKVQCPGLERLAILR